MNRDHRWFKIANRLVKAVGVFKIRRYCVNNQRLNQVQTYPWNLRFSVGASTILFRNKLKWMSRNWNRITSKSKILKLMWINPLMKNHKLPLRLSRRKFNFKSCRPKCLLNSKHCNNKILCNNNNHCKCLIIKTSKTYKTCKIFKIYNRGKQKCYSR